MSSTTSTADCLLSLHFEATALGSGFDVALELRQFVDRSGQRDWVQRGFLVNGVRFGDPRGFSLPQLEPEKVLAQPLELALQEKYRYALLGTDTVDGVLTYVVGVEPEDPKAVLFTGKVWIDGVIVPRRSGCSCSSAGGAAASSRRSRRRSTTWSPPRAAGSSTCCARSPRGSS